MSHDRESGATLIMVAIALMVLIGMAALALDLAQLRSDRTGNQSRTDAAATAAVMTLAENDAQTACQAAVAYVEINLGGGNAFPGIDCTAFPVTCDAATPAVTATATSGRHELTLVYPVKDTSPLMDPSAIGAPSQPAHTDDGDECDRFGVQLRSTHDSFFAGFIGIDSSNTQVHSVATPATGDGGSQSINLLILERHECDTVRISNSGGYGIIVGPVTDTATGEVFPGVMAVDSDGTVGCGAVMELQGSSSAIRADGPPGCPTETVPGSGKGCGTIQLFAPGVPGCNPPACTSSGTITPPPDILPEPITRAAIDYRYNCKSSYPVAWGIEGCKSSPDPNIDQIHAALGGPGQPFGYSSYTGAGYPCEVTNPLTVPPGNWYVDCPLSVKDELVFTQGNVVFADGVSITSGTGALAINAQPVTYATSSDAAIVYFQSGGITKTGQGSLRLKNASVIMGSSGSLALSGGSGTLEWIAPDATACSGSCSQTALDLDDLALWSDGTTDHSFSGDAAMDLEGVFFVPFARVVYTGNGAQQQVSAQFISRKLTVSGNGALVVSPELDRSVLFGATGAMLIR